MKREIRRGKRAVKSETSSLGGNNGHLHLAPATSPTNLSENCATIPKSLKVTMMVFRKPRRSAISPQTVLVFTTWAATSGNGARIGSTKRKRRASFEAPGGNSAAG